MQRVLRAVLPILAGLVVLAGLFNGASAEKRVALVVGNSAYQFAPKLTNPRNDAADVAAALKKHDFEVVDGFDLNKAAFDRKVRDFSEALKGTEAGVLFYAGHGLQVAGQNYLVPIDAKADEADALDFEMLRVDVIHRIMERRTNTNILFLDACRDNPLARNLARSMGTRSTDVGSGLARIETGVGTLISFSTQPGNVALDGAGRNSPFAAALVKQISSSTDDLSAILIAVRNDVMQQTQRKQVPWENSALTGRFYFGPAHKLDLNRETADAWEATKGTTVTAALEAFAARYPNTHYAVLARVRIEELRSTQGSAWPVIESTPGNRFDGYWQFKVDTSSGCAAKPWTYTLSIKGSEIYHAGKKAGKVEQSGKFFYERLNSNFPNLTVAIEGTLSEKAGKAMFSSGSCRGTYAIAKEGSTPAKPVSKHGRR